MFGSYQPVAYVTASGAVFCTFHGIERNLHRDPESNHPVPPREEVEVVCEDCPAEAVAAGEPALDPVPPMDAEQVAVLDMLHHRIQYPGSRN